jgi:molybdate transport system ATP-binding protein
MTLSIDIRLARADLQIHADLHASEGETVALLGPNGAGKSTVVDCVAGLLDPDEGRIAIDGEAWVDVANGRWTPAERRPVGVVFQDGLLFPHLSATENAAFPLRARGEDRSVARERATSLLARLGLPAARMDARPGELSGGESQRVALARALIHEPRLLLLDEPTASLDVRARSELRPLIRSILEGFAGVRVLITHDPVEAMTVADRIVVMERGEVTQRGTPGDLRNAPRTPYVADLVGVNLFAGRLEPLDEGAGRVVTGAGDVVVPWPADLRRGSVDGVLGVLRPSDVVLHTAEPEGSARNTVRGRIAEIAIEGERARVRLSGEPSVVAEITLGSVARLGLREGATVWASFKAVEVALVLP